MIEFNSNYMLYVPRLKKIISIGPPLYLTDISDAVFTFK